MPPPVRDPSRREALGLLAASLAAPVALARAADGSLTLATFSADVTPPLGHPLMGGGIKPAERIEDSLDANGFVLLGAGKPVVLCSVDWCEIRNEAYDRWRSALAEAAGTEPGR